MTSPVPARYPSDLTDEQWARLEPHLPAEANVGRHRTASLRAVANAINYRWECGCVWRMLPHDFPRWQTVYAYFRTWQRTGVIRELRGILLMRPKPARRFNPRPPASTPHAPPSDAPQNGFSPPDDRRSLPSSDMISEK